MTFHAGGIVPMRLVYDEPLDGAFTRLLLAEVRTIIGYGLVS